MPNNDLDKIAEAFKNNAKKNSTSTAKSNSTNKSTTAKSSSNNKSKTSTKNSSGKNYWGKNYYKNPNLNNKSSTSNTISKSVSKNVNSALNKSISSTISNNTNLSSSQTAVVTKQIKKLPLISKICIALLFIIGVAIGIGTCLFICRNDQFEINGKKNVTLIIGDSYSDAGVKVIGFGADMANQVTIEVFKDGTKVNLMPNEIDTSEECIYQIRYSLNNFRFRDVKIIRTILVVSPVSDDEPIEDDAYVDLGIEIDLFSPSTTETPTLQELIGDGTKESEVEHIYIANNNMVYILKKNSEYTTDEITRFCDYNSTWLLESTKTDLAKIVEDYNSSKTNANWITVTITIATDSSNN